MKKKIIKRIDSLINKANQIPDNLNEGGNETSKFKFVSEIRNEVNAFIKVNMNNDENHLNALENITFVPRNVVYNSGHFRNEQEWQNGKRSLLLLLERIKYEISEPIHTKETNKISFLTLGGILSFAIPFFLGLGYYFGNTQFNKDALECYAVQKVLLSKIDSLNFRLKINALPQNVKSTANPLNSKK